MAEGKILGIDLGTTHSLVGVVDSGFPILLADGNGNRLTPSAVFYTGDADGEILVGEAAMRARAVHPDRVITSVKRLMGRRGDEVDWNPPYRIAKSEAGTVVEIAGNRFRPEEISAEILKHLRQVAEEALGETVNRAVITVPAYFNDGQRNATKRAGEIAGLEVVRIVNEPTAAALAYGLDKLDEASKVAVYDLGGGTFDLSVLELNDGVFRVVATHGDTMLGGDDFDLLLAEWIWDRGGLGGEFQGLPDEVRAKLIGAAEAAKRRLSDEESTRVEIPFLHEGESLSVDVSRKQFEALIAPVVDRTRAHCRRAIGDSGLSIEELDAVILVGGSTRVPLVRRVVAEIFNREPDISQHPDEAVALGAVIQAGILSGGLREMVLLDVTPLSLGIETFGGLMNVIIPRNSTIPTKAGELFTNAVSGQSSILVRILQGEREMADDNWELGRVEVPFESGPKGSARVGVQFSIDENGILEVLARDTKTGVDTLLEIRDVAVDVDDEKVESMIAQSVEYAFDDMAGRVWTEARLKAEELLPAVDKALSVAGDTVDQAALAEIRDCVSRVKTILAEEKQDSQALKAAVAELDRSTEHLAATLVERAMEKAMKRQGL